MKNKDTFDILSQNQNIIETNIKLINNLIKDTVYEDSLLILNREELLEVNNLLTGKFGMIFYIEEQTLEFVKKYGLEYRCDERIRVVIIEDNTDLIRGAINAFYTAQRYFRVIATKEDLKTKKDKRWKSY